MQSVREGLRENSRNFDWDGPLEKEIGEWSSLYPGQPLDLERVLAYSHRKHYLRLMGSDEYFEHGSQSIVAVRKAIQHALILATPHNTPPLYRELAARLTPNNCVLTFNYDTLLEQALDDIGKPYTLTPEWWLEERSTGSGQRYVDLLKLHDSIDWYDRQYHDDAMRYHSDQGHEVPNRDPIFGPNPSVPSESLSRGPTGELGKHIVSRVYRVPSPLSTSLFRNVSERTLLPLSFHLPMTRCWDSIQLWTYGRVFIIIGMSFLP